MWPKIMLPMQSRWRECSWCSRVRAATLAPWSLRQKCSLSSWVLPRLSWRLFHGPRQWCCPGRSMGYCRSSWPRCIGVWWRMGITNCCTHSGHWRSQLCGRVRCWSTFRWTTWTWVRMRRSARVSAWRRWTSSSKSPDTGTNCSAPTRNPKSQVQPRGSCSLPGQPPPSMPSAYSSTC